MDSHLTTQETDSANTELDEFDGEQESNQDNMVPRNIRPGTKEFSQRAYVHTPRHAAARRLAIERDGVIRATSGYVKRDSFYHLQRALERREDAVQRVVNSALAAPSAAPSPTAGRGSLTRRGVGDGVFSDGAGKRKSRYRSREGGGRTDIT